MDLLDEDELRELRERADELAGQHEDSSIKQRTLDAQERIRVHGPEAFRALLELEQAYGERRASDVDVALAVGSRYGRTRTVIDLDESEQALLHDVALLGLHLQRDQRLRALVAALRIEVG